jgi:hypothetical protein
MLVLLAIGMGVGVGSRFRLGRGFVGCLLRVMVLHPRHLTGMLIFTGCVMLVCPNCFASVMVLRG